MKAYQQLCLTTLVCLGVALMLLASTADAQETYALKTSGVTGQSQPVGTRHTITFELTTSGGIRQQDVVLEIVPSGTPLGIEIINPAPSGGAQSVTVKTNAQGRAAVDVTITKEVRSEIRATPVPFSKYGVAAIAVFNGHIVRNPTSIVVLPPNSAGLDLTTDDQIPRKAASTALAVGDTFFQQVWIKNVIDLSAWQMDVAFNPQVLEATQVSAGNLLADGGHIPFFESTITAGGVSASQARIGQKSTTADGKTTTSLTNPSPAGVSKAGHLLTIEFKVLEFAEGALGLHNVQLSNSEMERISYYTVVNPYVVTHQYPREDVNRDGQVNIQDLVAVASLIGQSNPSDARADVNNDGMVNVLDLIAISHHASWSGPVTAVKKRDHNEWVGAAPAASAGAISPDTIRGWIDVAHAENDGSIVFSRGIANLERLLASEAPSETKLLLNYPNPFNPETWIPYQLAESAEVSVTIYSASGALVRTLPLGHQPAGLYHSRGLAAYWDGRTELGAQVASGIYFYTHTAGDFSGTRKMIVTK